MEPTQALTSPDEALGGAGNPYRKLLDQLTTNADSKGSGSHLDRMIDIRLQLTEFQLHYKFGMDEVLTKINVLREEFEHTRDYSPLSTSTTG
ncbi:hypothetical protein [Nesterenkonia pannonica]|uniref:hypothetical protein n=1 Tax=Nesterenkonia pannonica TaxID=1548602 RepID=UPI00216435B2|nr:hypothetical protein [Nesterenkonia pannonica]